MEMLKLKARIGTNSTLELLDPIPKMPPGEVEIIVLYKYQQDINIKKKPLPVDQWPTLNGGTYLGGSLRREDIYDDDGR